jgi:IPT/TIG domain
VQVGSSRLAGVGVAARVERQSRDEDVDAEGESPLRLSERHVGGRVVGIVAAAGFLVIGFQVPAFAASPTITSFTPGSGPTNCIVAVTGTAFADSSEAQTTVQFVPPTGAAVVVPDFRIVSATQIWARVPGLTPGAGYKIRITNNGGADESNSSFVSTSDAGECAPTISSLTPCSGSPGTTVVVTGMNLLRGTDPTDPTQQTEVRFFDYAAGTPDPTLAEHTIPNTDTPTQLRVIVPLGARDGPIRVTTFTAPALGQAFSTQWFMVPPPDDCPPTIIEHSRSVTLRLRRHLVARGNVTVGDAFADCAASVPVKIQRRVSGHWKTIATATTSSSGAYKKRIPDTPGKYRARAIRIVLNAGGDLCKRATSIVRIN